MGFPRCRGDRVWETGSKGERSLREAEERAGSGIPKV